MAPFHSKKKRKRLKLTIEQQWKKGIANAYRKFQIQRDQQILPESINTDPLPILADYPPIIEHEFLAPCKFLSTEYSSRILIEIFQYHRLLSMKSSFHFKLHHHHRLRE